MTSALAATAKAEAVHCWTNDPCGSVPGEPGTREYAERLVATRRAYAPWMASALDYAGAAGRDVLDVGSGQGIDLVEYARAGARVTGVDLTPRHVELARAHLQALGLGGSVVQGDAERLPLVDASFDRVSSNGVLHHTPDIDAALREVHRVLRLGGEARIVLYNRRSLHYWLWQVAWEGVVHRGLRREGSIDGVLSAGVERSRVGARPLVRVYSPRDVRRRLRAAGFGDVDVFVRHLHWGDVPYGSALERRGVPVPAVLARLAGWYVIGVGRRQR